MSAFFHFSAPNKSKNLVLQLIKIINPLKSQSLAEFTP
ncbi:hypothetical protein VCEM1676A_003290 [Vibrio cholerae O1 str. EM-1676A]|nr:hypothetical protein VCEM1676A_003290 [Vibrio cholerae O1 str. EM-1676A]